MNNIDFLKEQHLSMFEQKKAEHKNLIRELYRQYIADKAHDVENKWRLFSNFYSYFSKNFPAEIYEKECIVGTNWHWEWQGALKNYIVPQNNGHFIADFKDFLDKGIKGKIDDINKMIPIDNCENTRLTAMDISLKAFSDYIKKYSVTAREDAASASGENKERLNRIAEDCEFISENSPVNFSQAIQLIWFIQCFLDTESGNAAISFGRVDDYLYPYYKHDIQNKILTQEEALEIIMCFYIKVSEGNESTMLTVGGDKENELTSLFLEAQTRVNMRQPSIALRVSKLTSDNILNKAGELVVTGCGMPAFFNDDVIIKGLKGLGINDKKAKDYAIVGCYEAAVQGSFSDTVAYNFNIYDSFNIFLQETKNEGSFDEFLNAYKEFFGEYYQKTLIPELKKVADCDRKRVSPFASCIVRMDEKYFMGINMLGIGILIDSFYTVKKLVFDENYTTIENLKEQAERNFDDAELYNKILSLKKHYGSNHAESNQLARNVSEFIGKTVISNVIDDDVISSPALFYFTADIYNRNYQATINGRKKGELLSYGVMPCATPHNDCLTDTLMSCVNVATEYFPNGCPTMISLNKNDIKKTNVFSSVIRTYFEAGGYHLAMNTVDAKLLKDAKINPTEHKDVMVKISGYSTYFTGLDETIQNAVIERAFQEEK